MIICLVKVKKKIEKEKGKVIPFIFHVDVHLPCHMGYLLANPCRVNLIRLLQ